MMPRYLGMVPLNEGTRQMSEGKETIDFLHDGIKVGSGQAKRNQKVPFDICLSRSIVPHLENHLALRNKICTCSDLVIFRP